MFDLTGKKALITGASGGIGGAMAKTLHAAGAEVAVHGSREERVAPIKDELKDRVIAAPYNFSDLDGIETYAKDVEEKLGGMDVLIANAGITKDTLAMRMSDEQWNEVINTNLTATFKLVRAFLKGMIKRRSGRIIIVTSVVGHTGNAGQANYCASKSGLTGMAKALAHECAARGVTVNCIAPGFIATPMTDVLNDEQKARINTNIPAGRMGSPDDIAAAALYLASEQAAYVTGHTLHVNGGMFME